MLELYNQNVELRRQLQHAAVSCEELEKVKQHRDELQQVIIAQAEVSPSAEVAELNAKVSELQRQLRHAAVSCEDGGRVEQQCDELQQLVGALAVVLCESRRVWVFVE